MKNKIALFVYDPKCSVQCANGMINALSSHYEFRLFSKNEMEEGFFDDFDIVAFPGGIGDSDSFDNLLKHNKKAVTDFISRGGRYLGICMGAYWAGKNYFNILGDTDAVQYITQPDTDIFTEFETVATVYWHELESKMYFYDGCAFVGDLENCDIVATYDNGDAMAIVKNNVGVIGCHPESEKWWHEGIGNYENHHGTLLHFAINL